MYLIVKEDIKNRSFPQTKNKVVYCFIDSLHAWKIENFCPYDLLQLKSIGEHRMYSYVAMV